MRQGNNPEPSKDRTNDKFPSADKGLVQNLARLAAYVAAQAST